METVLSVCDGIGAAAEAWAPLGWRFSLVSEIDAFPRTVLKQRHGAVDAAETGAVARGVPLWGDFTALRMRHLVRLGIAPPSVLVGGTPCQAFSVAGLRQSLADQRGNLTLQFVRLANALDNARSVRGDGPAIIVWENVPGVLTTDDNAFGCFLAALVGSDSPLVPGRGQRWSNAGLVDGPRRKAAWCVKDAQYFGLAQRRRRVFVVASAREGFDPSAVLFEPEGLRRDSPPRRQTGQGVARGLTSSPGGASGKEQQHTFVGGDGRPLNPLGEDGELAGTLAGGARKDGGYSLDDVPMVPDTVGAMTAAGGTATPQAVAFSMRGRDGENQIEVEPDGVAPALRTATGGSSKAFVATTEEALAFKPSHYTRDKDGAPSSVNPPLTADADKGDQEAVVYTLMPQNSGKDFKAREVDISQPVQGENSLRGNQGGDLVMTTAVRRLTPTECERLQGFPDGFTLVRYRNGWAADGPRYKALGNSMAVPVMSWLGYRIEMHAAPLRSAA